MAPWNTFLTVSIMAGGKSVVTVITALRMSGEEACAGQGLPHLSPRRVSYHQRTLAAMSLLVGQQGIYLSVAEAGLVNTLVRADVEMLTGVDTISVF